MAEDEETPQEEAEALPKGKGKAKGRRRSAVEKPISLYPLTFEEAVGGLLQVKPEPGDLKRKKTGSD